MSAWKKIRRTLGFPRRLAVVFARVAACRSLWRDFPSAWRFFLGTTRMDEPNPRTTRFQWEGLPFDLRPMDWVGFKDVVLDREYEFLKALLPGVRGTAVDLGANVGLFSLYVLRSFPGLAVHAVEADPDTFAVMAGNRALNPSLPWTVHHLALAGADGTVRFLHHDVSASGRIAREEEPGRSVRAARWDTFMAQALPPGEIALVKMDIEGAEGEVLAGGAGDFSRVRRMVVEVHPGACDAAAVTERLRRSFPFLYRVTGRRSAKPLLVALHEAAAHPSLEAM